MHCKYALRVRILMFICVYIMPLAMGDAILLLHGFHQCFSVSFCSVAPDILLHTLPSCVVGHDKGSMLLIVLKISQSLSLSVSLKCAVVKEVLDRKSVV